MVKIKAKTIVPRENLYLKNVNAAAARAFKAKASSLGYNLNDFFDAWMKSSLGTRHGSAKKPSTTNSRKTTRQR